MKRLLLFSLVLFSLSNCKIMKVKEINEGFFSSLEEAVNKFIVTYDGNLEILDVKYAGTRDYTHALIILGKKDK